MEMFSLSFNILVLIGSMTFVDAGHYSLSDKYIEEINSIQSLWKAGRNFDPNTPLSHLRSILGVKKIPDLRLQHRNINYLTFNREDVPEKFDSREQWPKCASIKRIFDQASCGSCWAVSTASAMSDRLCIHSNGVDQRLVSANNLMSCCGLSNIYCGISCDGGNPFAAWIYWQTHGIVTGGAYNTSEGCQNYPFPSCKHHQLSVIPNCSEQHNENTKCNHICDDPNVDYSKELTFAERAYLVDTDTQNVPEMEIVNNGPIVADFAVFEDFFNYKSGIYKRVSNVYVGDHAVRVLGWGVENNVSYWLVANSWNDEWGDKGLFKILKDVNECGFENEMTAGLPKIST